MIKKLIYYLIRPRKLVSKIFQKRTDLKNRKSFDIQAIEEEQKSVFESLGLVREVGLQKKNSLASSVGGLDDSEHLTLFASISQAYDVKNILEIGTYDGKNAKYLSLLFPQADIETIDLSEDSPLFINSYNRSNPEFMLKFLKTREENLRSSEKIKFTRLNSLGLLNYESGAFDLIWVDGAHGYPIVAIDVANAIRLLQKGGLFLCDDVWVGRETNNSDFMYKSGATIETLIAFKEAEMIEFSLPYKRLNFDSAGNPTLKEHIAVGSLLNR